MNAKIRFIRFIFLFSAAAYIGATEKVLPLNSLSLSDWIITGAEPAALAQASQIVLPAGAQLARSFKSSNITLSVSAQPVFSADPANWSVLEIDSAALVFVRNGSAGGLMLVLGDNAPVALPYSYGIDEAGCVAESVQLNFSLSKGVLLVTSQGQTLSFPIELSTAVTSEVVISAGKSEGFPLGEAEVVLTTDDVTVGPVDGNLASDKNAGVAGSRVEGTTGSRASGSFWKSDSGKVDPVPKPIVRRSAPGDGLELFTPSSVRHGRADVVRTTVASILK